MTVLDGGVGTATLQAPLVAYDPSGSFVGGGRGIATPGSGKANTRFNANYAKGATTPTGSLEFSDQAAGVDLHSTTYRWLVTSGAAGRAPRRGGTDRCRISLVGFADGCGAGRFNRAVAGADPSTPIAGRRAEQRVLAGLVRDALDGRPAVALLTGPPGIGKTALLRALADTWPAVATVAVAADGPETAHRFGLADQIVRAAGGRPDWRAESEPVAVGATVLAALDTVSTAGALLLVDDVQWADHPSLEALAFALRRLGVEPVASVLAARTEDASDLAPIDRLVERPGSVRLELGPLTPEDVVAIARRRRPPGVTRHTAETLCNHVAGNPLHLLALLDDLADDDLAAVDAHTLPAPASFAEQVALRLAALDTDARYLVDAASVLGEGCSLAQAAAVADIAEPWAAVQLASAHGLVDPIRPGRPALCFPHALVRASVYQALTPPQRAQLHQRAAEIVGGPSALEHRAAASAGDDDQLAQELLASGSAEAQRGELDAALRAFLAAARVGPQATADRAAVLAADVLLALGEVVQAQRALAGAGADAPPAHRLLVEGTIAMLTGRPRDAEEALRAAWRAAPDDPTIAGRVAATLGAILINQGGGEETVTWTRRALELAGPASDAASMPVTMHALALGVLGRHDLDDLLREPPSAIADPSPAEVDRLLARGITRLWAGDADAASEALERAELGTRRRGSLFGRILSLYYASEAAYRLGLWDDAISAGQLAASLGLDAGIAWTVAIANATAVAPLAGRGQWDEAGHHLDLARDAAAATGDTASLLWVATAAARLAHARGNSTGVVESLAPMWSHRRDPGAQQPGIQPWLALRVEGLARSGDLAAARDAQVLLDTQIGEAASTSPYLAAVAARARLSLLLAEGDLRAVAAASIPAAAPPLDAALVTAATGAALRRLGRRRTAIETLRRARELLEGLGAAPYIERVDRELAASGVEVTAGPANSPLTSLTSQELAVAKLAAEGLTNREIAARLIIGVKTVEYHLSNVYAKLGIRSRSGVGAALARGPGFPDPR